MAITDWIIDNVVKLCSRICRWHKKLVDHIDHIDHLTDHRNHYLARCNLLVLQRLLDLLPGNMLLLLLRKWRRLWGGDKWAAHSSKVVLLTKSVNMIAQKCQSVAFFFFFFWRHHLWTRTPQLVWLYTIHLGWLLPFLLVFCILVPVFSYIKFYAHIHLRSFSDTFISLYILSRFKNSYDSLPCINRS